MLYLVNQNADENDTKFVTTNLMFLDYQFG